MTFYVDIDGRRDWECGCSSDNTRLTKQCGGHSGPVGTAKFLRADDPRLNVVFAPTYVTLTFKTAQGPDGKHGGLLSRESLMKVMSLIGQLDETPLPPEYDYD